MLTRRMFIGTAATVVALASALKLAAPSSVSLAIVDQRYPGNVGFRQAMAARGVAVTSFDGDVTDVWFRRLDPVWRSQAPSVVAGLTTQQALFCLEHLCWDRGLRVVERRAVGSAKLRSDSREELMWSWVIARSRHEVRSIVA